MDLTGHASGIGQMGPILEPTPLPGLGPVWGDPEPEQYCMEF